MLLLGGSLRRPPIVARIAVRKADGDGEEVDDQGKISFAAGPACVRWPGSSMATMSLPCRSLSLLGIRSRPRPAELSGHGDYAQLKSDFEKKLMRGPGIEVRLPANWIASANSWLPNSSMPHSSRGALPRFEAALADRTFSNTVIIPSDNGNRLQRRSSIARRRDCSLPRSCEQAEDCSSDP